jgi:hypothetical protein
VLAYKKQWQCDNYVLPRKLAHGGYGVQGNKGCAALPAQCKQKSAGMIYFPAAKQAMPNQLGILQAGQNYLTPQLEPSHLQVSKPRLN